MRNARDRSRPSLRTLLITPYAAATATLRASHAMRSLALLTGVNALGNGLFATVSILFYTQQLGFSIGVISSALVLATVLAIGGDLVAGKFSDTASPKPVLLAGLVLSALATALLLLVGNQASFVVALCLISLGQGLCMSSNTTLIRRLAHENPALARASLRSLLTLGISAGALLGGLVLASGGLTGFRIAILGNALTFVIAAVLLLGITVPPAPPGAPGRSRPVLPDRRFAVFSLANGAIGIYLHVLSFALPLWAAIHHPELIWVVGLLVALNALLTAAFQVPASAGIESISAASRRLVIGAACLALSYLFFLSGWSSSPGVLVLVMIVFLAAHTAGEVLYSAGTMELLFRLAPAQQQGQYGAFYGISNGLMSSVAPAMLGAAIALSGGWGWWLLAGATILLALLIRAVSRGAVPDTVDAQPLPVSPEVQRPNRRARNPLG
ncbi:MFS transporter [uncultured Brachybacterium sp.]|uniref:MFS transporter n=1 Tax=uncultured Brachybacterium sp. TaxID=189680 RepID=UPI00262E022F|nr:MFS transporter [uncultured Brachybacterium sp.]